MCFTLPKKKKNFYLSLLRVLLKSDFKVFVNVSFKETFNIPFIRNIKNYQKSQFPPLCILDVKVTPQVQNSYGMGVKVGVQVFRKELYIYIHLN